MLWQVGFKNRIIPGFQADRSLGPGLAVARHGETAEMNDRRQALLQWLTQLGYRDIDLAPASADASFRSYLRFAGDNRSLIVMDAPPQHEDCRPFVEVAAMLRKAGLSAPEVLAQDLARGFLLLTDFGCVDYLSRLDDDSFDALYGDALDALLRMQLRVDARALPPYDAAFLEQEMDLFRDWFIERALELRLDDSRWRRIKQTLIDSALAQPRVFVHRDYHSRNLMVLDEGNPGILDFQDAMYGPITYDLLSLLRDVYIAWPSARVEKLVRDYHARARDAGLVEVDSDGFVEWFDLMGVQRHLKVAGIFSRLRIRDGKTRYTRDIPRTLGYLCEVSAARPALAELADLISELDLLARAEAQAAA